MLIIDYLLLHIDHDMDKNITQDTSSKHTVNFNYLTHHPLFFFF
jgi:hypothetical protein